MYALQKPTLRDKIKNDSKVQKLYIILFAVALA